MKVFSVLGSPNKKGNTAALLQQYLKGVEENHSDVKIIKVFLEEMNINGCKGCSACKSGKIDNCVIMDDMNELYKKLKASDIVIFSTPIYCFSMTAQLKTFIDRLYALDYKTWRDKKIVLLTTYGDKDRASSGVVNAINIIKDMAGFLGIDLIQEYGVSTAILPASQNNKALDEAYELGKKL